MASEQFSLYAYKELKKELSKVEKIRLLIPNIDNIESSLQSLIGSHLDRHLRNNLDISRIALDCSKWLKEKCEVRQASSPIPQNLIHLSCSHQNLAIMGSASFTTDGL